MHNRHPTDVTLMSLLLLSHDINVRQVRQPYMTLMSFLLLSHDISVTSVTALVCF